MTNATTASALLPDLHIPLSFLSPSKDSSETLPPFRANAHIHLPPNFTAFDTVQQAVSLAAEQGVSVLGASNYYDYAVYREFATLARERNIFPVFGLEIITLIDDLRVAGIKINDPGNPGKMYLCGKGIARFDPLSGEAAELLAVIRNNDSARMDAMTDRLATVFAAQGLETHLDTGAIKERIAQRHGCPVETVYLQERHLAQAFQEALFAQAPLEARRDALLPLFGAAPKSAPEDAVGIQGEIRSQLMKAGKSAFVEETFVGFDHAYRLVLALGGIPCYPTLADGANPICEYEADVPQLVSDLQARNLHCAEFIPIRNTPEVLAQYVFAMRRAGLIVTAGTEHNTLDLLPLNPTCLHGQPIPDEVAAIFREGTCVVAAHQYLSLQGAPGFVNDAGQPNPAFTSDEERIAAFARFGDELLLRYQKQPESE